jgi:hypothetical protein
MSGSLYAQSQASDEAIQRDIESLQGSVNEVVSGTVPSLGLLQLAKGTYLDGYGVVLFMEVALEPPRTPFSGFGRTASEVRTAVSQRRKATVDGLTTLLKQRTPRLESLSATESVTIILHLLNTNPADLPDLPSQLVLSVKKQDAPTGRISLREYK